jgi:ribonuclease D
VPGLTETSLLPKAAAAEGVGFDELVQEMVDVSLDKRRSASSRIMRVIAA